MAKRVAIVGAGMAGLSAGVYARINGYEVDIFESGALPGGLCTAWKRDGYTFDGCIHWFTGSRPGHPFYPLWEEVGAVQGRTFDDPASFYTFAEASGRTCTLYADVERLEQHLLRLSPEDAEPARELCGLVRTMKRMRMPMDKAFELFGPVDLLKMIVRMLPFRKTLSACTRASVTEFAARFKDPLIRACLENALHPRSGMIALVMTLADLSNRAAGYPLGGSLPVARAVEQRCTRLGARVHYRRRVRRVLVRGGAAVGLELEDGSAVDADVVISAADLRKNLEGLLEGRFPSAVHERLLRERPLYPSVAQISFGINKSFPEPERAISHWLQLPHPPTFAGRKLEWLHWKNYSHDRSLAPEGHSVVTSLVDVPYEWWKQLGRPSQEYRQAKAELASLVQVELDRVLPGFADAVRTVDVATPLTYERYTSNSLGTFMTWVIEKGDSRPVQMIPKVVPGLKGFYMAGMWMMGPGGLPCALKTARDVVQLLCKSDRVRFQTSAPEKQLATG